VARKVRRFYFALVGNTLAEIDKATFYEFVDSGYRTFGLDDSNPNPEFVAAWESLADEFGYNIDVEVVVVEEGSPVEGGI
jgi:hypothetical protein